MSPLSIAIDIVSRRENFWTAQTYTLSQKEASFFTIRDIKHPSENIYSKQFKYISVNL